MTVPKPDDQTRARRRGTLAAGSVQRAKTAAPGQRIFVSGDRIVEKPPVLFKIPSVKLDSDKHNSSGVQLVADTATESALTERSTGHSSGINDPGASSSRNFFSQAYAASTDEAVEAVIDTPSFDAGTPKSGGHGVRAPHFLQSRAVKNPGGDSAPSSTERSPAASPPLPKPDSFVSPDGTSRSQTGRSKFDDDVAGIAEAHAAERELERLKQVERTSEVERASGRSPRTEKSLPPVPDLTATPSGRSWMEVLGSRLVILLLVAAIGAIAFLANRDSQPRSLAELANLELDNNESSGLIPESVIDRLEAKGSPQKPAPSQELGNSGQANATLNHQPVRVAQSAPQQPVAATPERSADLGNSTTSSGSNGVEPVEPNFNLSDLLGAEAGQIDAGSVRPNAPANSSSPSSTAPHALNTSAASNSATSINPPSLTAPQQVEPLGAQNQVNAAPASDWQKDLDRLGSEYGMNHSGTVNPPALAGNAAGMTASGINPNQAQRPGTIQENRLVREPSADGSMLGPDSDAAISAAIDAARWNRSASQGQPVTSYDEPVMTTAQPVGVSDWSRYLPANVAPNPAPQMPSGQWGNGMVPGSYQPGLTPPDNNNRNMMPPGMINQPSVNPQQFPTQTFSSGNGQPLPAGNGQFDGVYYGPTGDQTRAVTYPGSPSNQYPSNQWNVPSNQTQFSNGGVSTGR